MRSSKTVTVVTAAQQGPPGPAGPPGSNTYSSAAGVYTARNRPPLLPLLAQLVPCNTTPAAGGSFSLTLPDPPSPPRLIVEFVDTGAVWPALGFGGNPLTVLPSPGTGIYSLASRALASAALLNQAGQSQTYAVVTGDPANPGTWWMPIDGSVGFNAVGGVVTSSRALAAVSQLVLVNTNGGPLAITLPSPSSVLPAVQVAFVDTGAVWPALGFGGNPLTVIGGACPIWDYETRELKSEIALDVGGETAVLTLISGDPVNGTFWMLT
jgi:hypothetical protein